MPGYSRSCFMCKSKQLRGARSECSFHRFPSDASVRSKWLQFCKLTDVDDVSKICLCSHHFTPTDFTNYAGKKFSGYLKLKVGAVPVFYHHDRQAMNSRISSYALPQQATTSSTETTCSVPASESVVDEMFKSVGTELHLVKTSEEQLISPCNKKCINVNTQTETCLSVEKVSCTVSYWCEASTQTGTPELELEETVSASADSGQTSEMDLSTPKKRRFAEPRYAGDIRTPDVATPRRAKRSLQIVMNTVEKQAKKVRALQEQRRCMKKKLKSMKDMIDHLQNKSLISEDLASSLMDGLPEHMKQMLLRKRRHARQYPPELRSFALTLQFYSAKAYTYIRRVWGNLLPHPATLRAWYQVVDGAPGFSREAFEAISRKEQPICNIVIDEMSIREQMLFSHGKFYGGVNLGAGFSSSGDNTDLAKNALVFMAVALNGSWKVPVGYFLIKGLGASERANLLIKCLELMHETSAKVLSITFDGASVNLSMCTKLGANFNYGDQQFRPFIQHPKTKEKVFIFFDMCHMIKLIRNTLGDKGYLFDGNNNKVSWEFIANLEKLQNEEGLTAGTKLSRMHINFNDNRMKVKLAVQTLSESVYNALRFVKNLNIESFQDSQATSEFCINFNNAFDILNCKNKFSKDRFRVPLNEANYTKLYEEANRLISYIEGLKDKTRIPILQSQRKTGFLGTIICLKNMFHLFKAANKMDYLLSFKLSQDFLETFFSAVRARGGWNNNPNALQFEAAYKRLLLRHDIREFENSNCLADDVQILGVSAKKKRDLGPVATLEGEIFVSHFDHDYVRTLWTLTPYIENVIAYISGFIVSKLLKKTTCAICSDHLTSIETPLLIKLKNRGRLLSPSAEVVRICKIAEKVLRENTSILLCSTNIQDVLINKIIARLGATFNSEIMKAHILSQDILDNHCVQLVKSILDYYLTIRLHHEGRLRSQKDASIRHKYNKLILFHNQ